MSGLLISEAIVVLPPLLHADTIPAAQSPSSRRISAQEFLASPAARALQAGDDTHALHALDALLTSYPDDPLLLRYRALVLAKLGRTRESIALYRQLLVRDPAHVPTHMFLGRAYLQRGDAATAANEWRWVMEHSDDLDYRRWAQTQLQRLRVGVKHHKPPEQRLFVFGVTGLKYDSNPLLKPSDKALAAPGNEKQGYDALLDLTVGYPVLLQRDRRLDVLYLSRQTFRDESTDAADFTSQGLEIAAKQRIHGARRAYLLGARYTAQVDFLRSDLFAVIHQWVLSAQTAFTPHTRTYVYTRASLDNFGPDGSNPPQTSRDGFRGGLGVTQFFYTRDFRRYLFVNQEVSLHDTRGANFTRRGTTSRIGVHTTLDGVPRTDWEASAGLERGVYPRFVSLSALDTTRRRDLRYDVYTALTYHWTPHLATRLDYRFIRNDNRNDFYDRTRHIAGMEMVFSY